MVDDYTEDFTNKTVNFMRKMVHRVGACTGNTDANPCMSGLYFQEETTGIQYYIIILFIIIRFTALRKW